MTTLFDIAWKKIIASIVLVPGFCLALSSGPGMPEYNDFESVENTDMVNLATGDFTYSIPVMTVPGPGLGFPLVLSYHAGIQPEQEASWVGLGWNLQAGAITRQVNNFPDDFKNTLIEERIKSTHIHGWMASVCWNGATVGLSWDSENALGGMVGYAFREAGVGVTAGVNGVYEGIGVSFSVPLVGAEFKNVTAGASLSIGVHSKQGVTAGLGVGIGAKDKAEAMGGAHTSASLASAGVSLSSKGGASAGASVGVAASASTSVKQNVSQKSSSYTVPMWTPATGYMSLSWGTWDIYINGLQEDYYYGFIYSDSLSMGCVTTHSPKNPGSCYMSSTNYGAVCPGGNCAASTVKRAKKMDYNDAGEYSQIAGLEDGVSLNWVPANEPKVGSTGEDIYSVQTQGISGTFRPYRAEDGDYYSYLSNQDYDYQATCQGWTGSWFGKKCARNGTINFGKFLEGDTTGAGISRDRHGTDYSQVSNLVWRFNDEIGGALYTNPGNRDAGPTVSVASRKIEPYYDATSGRINGWILTSSDGVRYLYTEPQYNYIQQVLSADDANLSTWTRRETPFYAYAWLIGAILSPDYVSMGECEGLACLPEQGDIGGWVRFDYTSPKVVSWKTPVGAVSAASSFSMGDRKPSSTDAKVTAYTAASGMKTVGYLSAIETPTHRAEFDLEERADAQSPDVDSMGYNVPFSQGSIHDSAYCNDEGAPYPHARPRRLSKVLIPVSSFSMGTKVSIIANRLAGWTKWVFLDRRCRTGFRDEIAKIHTLTSGDTVGGNFEVSLGYSSEIHHVRVVIGEMKDIEDMAPTLSLLRQIRLRNKAFDREVSAVRFTYDYSLAQGTPNSESSIEDGDGGNQGRLTLKAINMGAGSRGPWNPAYQFYYNGTSTSYNADKKDYWGYYCQGCSEARRRPDGTGNKWNLEKVIAPSGSEVRVSYEPKRVDFSEGIPLVMDGNQASTYFEEFDNTVHMTEPGGGGSYTLAMTGARMPQNAMAEEVMDYFNGKYVVFLGSFDVPKGGKANLSTFPSLASIFPGASSILLSTARYFIEASHIKAAGYEWESCSGDPEVCGVAPGQELTAGVSSLNFNGNTDSTITSSRIDCDVASCTYYVGWSVNGNSNVQVNASSQGGSVRVRVWASISKTGLSSPPHTYLGSGVRVSQLLLREPFGGKENIVDYSYGNAVTPTLPDPSSNYSLGILYPDAAGEKFYIGNPALLHEKTTASYRLGGSSKYTTEYHFVTSKDLPVRIEKILLETDSLHSRIKIVDRSGLWGSLWKKVEKDSSGLIVRSDLSQWASRIDSGWKYRLSLEGGEGLDLSKDGNLIFKANDSLLRVFHSSTIDSTYFGVTQKLFGGRFIPARCDAMDAGEGQNGCLATDKAYSTQIEVVRFAPLNRKRFLTQDGLVKTTESNLFDFMTGSPLLDIQHNKSGGEADEYIATLKSLAYHHDSDGTYDSMRTLNMLSQEFSTTTFRFSTNPANKDFTSLSSTDLGKVVSSEFTVWKDFSSGPGIQFRKSETFVLRDTSGFSLPTPSFAGGSKWRSQGKSVVYDVFGHVEEFRNALGQTNAQVHGYGKSLPTAFVQNANRKDVYYQSFEVAEDLTGSSGKRSISRARSKTGNGSLRVGNCKEKGPGGLLSKTDCGIDTANTMVCYPLSALSANKTYEASVWYYDEYQGSNLNTPSDTAYLNKKTRVTRPGLYFGGDSSGCRVDDFPNGAHHDVAGTSVVLPAGNTAWNADQRATGSGKWKRLWVRLNSNPACSGVLQTPQVCLYASKNKGGSDVYYDELRVRPKNSLMTTYAYDHRGNMIASADANETVTRFEYDAFGNLSGIRNDAEQLVSEQAKQFGIRRAVVTFPTRDPVPMNDTVCQGPDIRDASGLPVIEDYTLLSSSDTKVAWMGTGGDANKVCTSDKGGMSIVQMETAEGIRKVPIIVKGTQLGIARATCDLPSSNGSAPNRCRINIAPIKARLKARGDSAAAVAWVLAMDFRYARGSGVRCFDGAPEDQDTHKALPDVPGDNGEGSCGAPPRFPRQNMHVRFTRFVQQGTTLNELPNGSTTAFTPPLVLPDGPAVPFAPSLPLFGVGVDWLRKGLGSDSVYYSTLKNVDVFDLNSLLNGGPKPIAGFQSRTIGSIAPFLYTSFENGSLNVRKKIAMTSASLRAIEAQSGSAGSVALQIAYVSWNGSGWTSSPACITPSCNSGSPRPGTVTNVIIYVY